MRRLLIAACVAGVVMLAIWQPWSGPVSSEDTVELFLKQHWADPIAPQGEPPAEFSPLEASLGAEACAQCHPEQHRDWSQSLHRQAIGPGIMWQLRLMDQGSANRCLRCHAPLAEQKALLAREFGWPKAPREAPPAYVPSDLGHQGVMCSSCHLRGHKRYGPPARQAANESAHGGFESSEAYADSRFCGTCHQFAEDGPRINGKLKEDTLAQWQASSWASEKTCQQCHMPERRHEFRGVHDREMVRKAAKLTLEVLEKDAGMLAKVALSNIGAGHHFPTYMVPKIYLHLWLVGPEGQRKMLTERTVGWQIDTAITEEFADTRIPAGETFSFEYPFNSPQGLGWALEVSMDVAPREHYERVFTESLKQADLMDEETLALLRQALDEARNTRYEALRLKRMIAGDAM